MMSITVEIVAMKIENRKLVHITDPNETACMMVERVITSALLPSCFKRIMLTKKGIHRGHVLMKFEKNKKTGRIDWSCFVAFGACVLIVQMAKMIDVAI